MGISKGCVSEPRGHCTRNLPGPKANILINQNGHACLADFSLVTIASDPKIVTPLYTAGGMLQWMSPELIDPESFNLTESRPTKESDCYALGMVIYEVLSGQTPFAPSRGLPIILKVMGGDVEWRFGFTPVRTSTGYRLLASRCRRRFLATR